MSEICDDEKKIKEYKDNTNENELIPPLPDNSQYESKENKKSNNNENKLIPPLPDNSQCESLEDESDSSFDDIKLIPPPLNKGGSPYFHEGDCNSEDKNKCIKCWRYECPRCNKRHNRTIFCIEGGCPFNCS